MNVLLVEDDDQKLEDIYSFLMGEYPGVDVSIARSFASGLRLVMANKKKADLVLMDMSMPSFDISEHEPSGGAPEGFAGRELLAQMKLRSVLIPTIVVTMFDSFGEKSDKKSLDQLTQELKGLYSPPFFDLVYYDSRQEGWRSALRESIGTALRK
ncbi:hypothetical protein PSH28_07380 [Pseudomonas resinovorans]|uniref:hypothetical protein n=1 Tax=Metapseudomonas resinovorans TaxID=53412 RepID=UPI00237F21B5|nr:hypothetical protein [Pseudomonas resinovorans]MDE3736408.1 hypothetical protein [Pseudomonas resinovorans]